MIQKLSRRPFEPVKQSDQTLSPDIRQDKTPYLIPIIVTPGDPESPELLDFGNTM